MALGGQWELYSLGCHFVWVEISLIWILPVTANLHMLLI